MILAITIPGEEWKPIRGYEREYEISNMGRVRSLNRIVTQKSGQVYPMTGKILSPSKDGCGYLFVSLTVNGLGKKVKVHRLVAEHFIANYRQKPQVNHIDGDKNNNSHSNLEWCTNQENYDHSWATGLRKYNGEGAPNNKLSTKEVEEIRAAYIKGDTNFGAKPLARRYGVSNTTIRNIVKNKKWRRG